MAAAAKSNALQLEMELNEVLCDASVDEERGLPSMCVMKMCGWRTHICSCQPPRRGSWAMPRTRFSGSVAPHLLNRPRMSIGNDAEGSTTLLAGCRKRRPGC